MSRTLNTVSSHRLTDAKDASPGTGSPVWMELKPDFLPGTHVVRLMFSS
jgi:hypothetical protein